jgi:hypothetical protein
MMNASVFAMASKVTPRLKEEGIFITLDIPLLFWFVRHILNGLRHRGASIDAATSPEPSRFFPSQFSRLLTDYTH